MLFKTIFGLVAAAAPLVAAVPTPNAENADIAQRSPACQKWVQFYADCNAAAPESNPWPEWYDKRSLDERAPMPSSFGQHFEHCSSKVANNPWPEWYDKRDVEERSAHPAWARYTQDCGAHATNPWPEWYD